MDGLNAGRVRTERTRCDDEALKIVRKLRGRFDGLADANADAATDVGLRGVALDGSDEAGHLGLVEPGKIGFVEGVELERFRGDVPIADESLGVGNGEKADAPPWGECAEGPRGGADVIGGNDAQRNDNFPDKGGEVACRVADDEKGCRAVMKEKVEVGPNAGGAEFGKVFAEGRGNHDESGSDRGGLLKDLAVGWVVAGDVGGLDGNFKVIGEGGGESVLIRSVWGDEDLVELDLG